MVAASLLGRFLLMAVEESNDAVIEQLKPEQRVAVVMALLGLTLVGLFLITFTMVGGHWVRRLARHRPGQRRAAKAAGGEGQLRDALAAIAPDAKSGDTVLFDTRSKDTRIDN